MPEADPEHYVRGQYDGYLDIPGVATGSTTETYAARRLEIQNWRWSACPGSSVPASDCPSHRPRCASSSASRRGWLPPVDRERAPLASELVIKLDPTTGVRIELDAHRADRGGAQPITLDMEFAQEGGEGPTPYEVLLHAAMRGDSVPFTRQDGVEETWRIMRPADRGAPRRCIPTRRAPGGRREADRLVQRRLAAGTDRGWCHELDQGQEERPARRPARPRSPQPPARVASDAAERRGAVAVHADRRLRVPVGLPHRGAGRARRHDRLAVHPAVRLAERVRVAARPRRRRVPPRPVRDQRAERPALRAGHEHARHQPGRRRRGGPRCTTR